jgi:hypothetical protein
VTGVQAYSDWQGALFPNCTSLTGPLVPWHNDSNLFELHLDWSLDSDELAGHLWKQDCGDIGCLFNIEEDPNETNNLAAVEGMGGILDELRGHLADANKGLFEPDRCAPPLSPALAPPTNPLLRSRVQGLRGAGGVRQ